METTIQHIELINQYLNNLLSGEEKLGVLQKLENDSEFNQLYHEHLSIIGGIERAALKQELASARQTYTAHKWIKFSGIAIIVIGTIILLYTILNASKTENEQPVKDENNSIIQFNKTSSETENQTALIDTITDNYVIDSAIDTHWDSLQTKYSSVFESFKKQSDLFNIDVNRDTVITCKEGSVLKIKANSFVNSNNNNPVNGKIEFEVTEYYKLSDMLLANLTTTSNGKQLETGGMLYIEASQDNTLLNLSENATIEISFPTKKRKEGMQMFTGLKGENGIDWVAENYAVVISDEPEELIEVPFSLVEQVPVFPGCQTIIENEINARRQCFNDGIQGFIQKNFNTDIFTRLGLTGRQRIVSIFKINEKGDIGFVQSNAPHPDLIQEANRVIGLLPRMQPGRQRGRNVIVPYSIPIIFQIQGSDIISNSVRLTNRDSTSVSNNQVKVNMITYDTIYVPSRGMIEKLREVMHDEKFVVDSAFINRWNYLRKENLIREFNISMNEHKFLIKKEVFEAPNTKFKILEDDSITRGGHVIRIPWDATKIPTTTTIRQLVPIQTFYGGNEVLTAEEFENRIEDEDKTKDITTSDVNNYILKTSQLGWINCDRFINARTKRIKYKLKIKNSDNTIVNMIFKSVNSVLPSWKSNDDFDFGTVSDNTDVVLMAITKQDGKLFLDIVETKTTINPSVNFEFREVTLREMKAELEKLDNLFD